MQVPSSLHWLSQDNIAEALARQYRTGALQQVLPEVAVLYGVPQRAEYHPEVDTGRHIELCLDAAEKMGASSAARFAVLVHDLGKGITPAQDWPRHHDHESTGVPLVHQVCERLGTSEYTTLLAAKVCRYHLYMHPGYVLQPKRLWAFFEEAGLIGADTPPSYVKDFVIACASDHRGRLGSENSSLEHHERVISLVTHIREQGLHQDLSSVERTSSAWAAKWRHLFSLMKETVISHVEPRH